MVRLSVGDSLMMTLSRSVRLHGAREIEKARPSHVVERVVSGYRPPDAVVELPRAVGGDVDVVHHRSPRHRQSSLAR